jgi:hypothetical protein
MPPEWPIEQAISWRSLASSRSAAAAAMASGSGVFWTMISMLRAPSRTEDSRASLFAGVMARLMPPPNSWLTSRFGF